MKKACLAASLLSICICVLAPAEANAVTRVIADDGRASNVSCEAASPTLNSIQAAVDVSTSGDTILVCPGIYEEQVKIVSKDLTIRGVASGERNLALIKPHGMVANSTNTFSGGAVAAIIAVEDSGSVTLINLTIDGGDNRLTGCDPTLIGVFYRNASGEVRTTAVRNIRFGPELGGCSSGIGIFAQSGVSGTSRLTVYGSSVHDYQKAGVVANEDGTELHAIANSIAGLGVTPSIAQNGIQIGFGAGGTITQNSIVNHVYTCLDFPCFASTGVLIFQADSVKVTENSTAKSIINIYLSDSDHSEIMANIVSDSDVSDGIAVVGSNNRVGFNRIFNSDEFGVYVKGDDNRIEKNWINDAPCGIFTDGSNNAVQDNSFFNTDLKTCEPFMLSRQSLSRQSLLLRPVSSEVILPEPKAAR
jgi:copper-binding protein NosD